MHQLLFAVLLSAAAAAPTSKVGTFKFPVRERSLTKADGTVNGAALIQSLNSTLIKYGHTPLPPMAITSSSYQKRATANEILTDQVEETEDELYYGPITIGAAKQKFTVDFDTGSADLFIPGPKCGSSQGCTGSTKYNQKGQDQNKTTSVTYGSGSISGEDYKDTVTVAGLTVPDQGFISLTNASGFSSSDAEGLMGLGFSTIAQTGYPTFMESLVAENKTTLPEFSFFLGREKSSTQGKSELTIGGADSSRYTGTPHSVAVTKQGYWQVAVDGVAVGAKSAGAATKGQAAIDTGTSIVLAPTAAAAAIFKQIPGSIPIPISDNGIQLYTYPCNTKATPAFIFAGAKFVINPLDFNLGSLGAGLSSTNFLTQLGVNSSLASDPTAAASYCIAGLGGADLDTESGAIYIVGDVFLKNWYSIFSFAGSASVSFAPAAGNQ